MYVICSYFPVHQLMEQKVRALFFLIYTLMKLSGQLVVLERVKASKKCVVCTVKCFVHLGTI